MNAELIARLTLVPLFGIAVGLLVTDLVVTALILF